MSHKECGRPYDEHRYAWVEDRALPDGRRRVLLCPDDERFNDPDPSRPHAPVDDPWDVDPPDDEPWWWNA